MNFSKRDNRIVLIAILSIMTILSSCADRYIGKEVDTSYWWQVGSLPASALIGNEDDYLVFEITISKGEAEGEYLLEGNVDPTIGKAKSWTHFQTNKCHFSLLLAKDGVITERVSFIPVGSSLGRKLPFKKKFNANPFDALTIVWKAGVRG